MALYMALNCLTDDGMRTIKKAPERLEGSKRAAREAGVEIKAFYLTIGEYDFVTLIEAPDDIAIAKFMLALEAKGNVRAQTMRLYSEEDYRNIVAALP